MITFYLVRHGTTEANIKKVIQGQHDAPLTPKGVVEVEHLAQKLRDIQFSAIYASDLGRAFITEFIIAYLNHEENLIHGAKELRELNFGDYENHKKVEIIKKDKRFRDPDYILPHGESVHQAQGRAVKFLNSLETHYNNQNVLIVTHSVIIRTIIAHYANVDLHKLLMHTISHKYIGKFVIKKGKTMSYDVLSK